MGDTLRQDLTVLTEREVAVLSTVFSLLAGPTRLRIVLMLCAGERRVSDVAEALGMPQPTVSHQLGALRRAGLLVTRRQGKAVFYSLEKRLAFDPATGDLRVGNASGVTIHVPTRCR